MESLFRCGGVSILPILLSALVLLSSLVATTAGPQELVVNKGFETGALSPWTQTVGINEGGEVHVETHARSSGDPGSGAYVLHTRIGGQANGHTSVSLAQDISSAGVTTDMQISLSFYNKNTVNPCGSLSPPMADCWRIVLVYVAYERADQSTGAVAWGRYWYCDGTQCSEWVFTDIGLEGTATFDVDEKIPQADRNAGTTLTRVTLENAYKTFQTRGGSSTEKLDVFWDDVSVVAAAPTRTVTIDIKPGSALNAINPDSRGVIPVAILSAGGFDAGTVDPATVRFGPSQVGAAMAALEDVDGDGDSDMILHFRTEQTGIACDDSTAQLTGNTRDGTPIEASDSIVTVSCE